MKQIIREGDVVPRMVFIVRGSIRRTQNLSKGMVATSVLEPGGFLGDELLSWCLRRPFIDRLPASSATFVCLESTEAFGLDAQNLRYITDHFRYKFANERLKRTARYHSSNWRTWAAVNIQVAYRRYRQRTRGLVTLIIREGDVVPRMVFIVRGSIRRTQNLSKGMVATSVLEPGGFLGDELLSWCLRRPFIDRLPASSATFVCLESTEAFGLDAQNLRYITDHFRYKFANERLKRTARYHSSNWRTWAAVNIQVAYRRYRQRTRGLVTLIIREGDVVPRMVFIVRGSIRRTQNLSKGMVATSVLEPGGFLGDELLSWCLRRPFIDRLPASSATFVCLESTEAFGLDAQNLRYITDHFWYKFANERLKRTARYHSSNWRTWAAVNIQVAYRRYRQRTRGLVTLIIREGDVVPRMVFIVRGSIRRTQNLSKGMVATSVLEPGGFLGDELLSWCLRRPFIDRLPASSATFVCLESTEAFGLDAQNLRYITDHFRYKFANERLKRTARYHSSNWRTWAAVNIQVAYRRYRQRTRGLVTLIIREGDVVPRMVFIVRGSIRRTQNLSKGMVATSVLEPGGFLGDELLSWCLRRPFIDRLPASSATFVCLESTEAFGLDAQNLRYITDHFWYKFANERLKRTARYHSSNWRTWAAVNIQVAYRRYRQRTRGLVTLIIREGDVVPRMVFIVRGSIRRTQNLSKGMVATSVLEPGGFLGDELLSWCLRRPFIDRLPASSATFVCLESTEAFGLDAQNLRYMTDHFWYKFANERLKRTARYHSSNWRTWAAVNIQVAYRHYRQRTRGLVTLIIREGDVVPRMVFIVRGSIRRTQNLSKGMVATSVLEPGGFLGDELLSWCLRRPFIDRLPASSATFVCLESTEAFGLDAQNLRYITDHFRYKFANERLKRTTRYHSSNWRTWAAVNIQVAYRRYRQRTRGLVTLIIREGDVVPRMVFIVRGSIRRTQNLSKGMVATSVLEPGGFLGDELLSWCLRRPFIDRLSASSATFVCLESTEAFGLDAQNLRYITDHFRYKFANERLKRTARYHSSNWRTWAAVNIQVAYRRYRQRTRGLVTLIIREGDVVPRMVFIVRGSIRRTQNLSKGMVATSVLEPGGFLGDELLSWCLRRPFIDRLPASSATFVCLESTEAFGLDAQNLRYITDHFRYKFANERLKRTARYHSSNWRTWAAVNIQVAYRRYRQRTRGNEIDWRSYGIVVGGFAEQREVRFGKWLLRNGIKGCRRTLLRILKKKLMNEERIKG
ncbi:unnamed protein product [Trifolium pratense]|uniref:Uncharacterized protein n=1 Tax=Trifolium pratense TaxID=57577 RepID=A0ACB0IPS2_TRIPR|nr:unnamed protein product [Trifolium pratense]